MSCTSEVGISPVLLQAISHTLTSTENQATADNNSTFDRRRETNGFRLQECKTKEATSAILQFTSEQESETKIVPLLHGMHEPTAPLIRQVQVDGNGLSDKVILDASPEVKAMLKQKINQRVIFKPHADSVIISDGNTHVVNVYTAIENSELKGKDLSGLSHEIKIIDSNKYSGAPEVIVCYNQDSPSVPSPANDIIVSDSDNGIIDTSQKTQLTSQHSSEQDSASPSLKFNSHLGEDDDEEDEEEDEMGNDSNSNSQAINSKESVQTIYISPSEEIVPMSFPVHTVSSETSLKDTCKNCPVCDDKVSGYHYGIFSCESCKGFFKRTVQNKKAYKCHQKGSCDINVYNRKKCPACRFTKCLEVGMKLEAIRVDRTRGGRSSYDGCSPHGRARERQADKRKIQKLNMSKSGTSQQTQQHSVVTIPGITLQAAGQNKASQLVAILSHKNNSMGNIFSVDKKPFVPQILTDIMNLESFLCDDEPSIEILSEDASSYVSLMQITEDRLYKIVRWARNLAQFTSISTDDQILLLQNCWSDLLLLECCYRSKEKPTEIRLAQGNTVSVDVANSLGMGSVVSMVVELAEQLNRLKVDLYEFVGLKVLVLITPDVKGLKNPEKTRDHQEKLCEALDMYTSSHYPQHPNKFGEMILTLPTLSRISIKGKELITDSQLKDISSYGLLYELLKGENAIKDPSNTNSA